MELLLTVLTILLASCFFMLWRNELAYSISREMIGEVYKNKTEGDNSLEWSDIPNYYKIMFDLRVCGNTSHLKIKPTKEKHNDIFDDLSVCKY